jgi:hypothetical protein
MQKESVTVVADVNCKWSGESPRYRCYVNDELFTERTWIWSGHYLEEAIPIYAEPGRYRIRYELVDNENAKLKVGNFRVKNGTGTVDQKGCVWISTPGIT